MGKYKLLTPGPLTTSETVKEEMLFDHCTWDDEYKNITQEIREEILNIAGVSKSYTCVLVQGSGTFGVEAMITTFVGRNQKLLILTNGHYGERIIKIATYAKLNHVIYEEPYHQIPNAQKVEEILANDPEISHVIMVHSETTSGILNDIESVGEVVKKHDKIFLVDAMSSFGGVEMDWEKLNVGAIVTSSNKCIQGVPGFSIILVKKEIIEHSKGNATTLSLDLYEQYQEMNKDGKWRFTSPTHSVIAFSQAIKELYEEGGVKERHRRYQSNKDRLVEGMKSLGFETYVPKDYQGPIITTFLYPTGKNYDFHKMYAFIKDRGYAIYPGKLTDVDTFRIGNIGEIYSEDVDRLLEILKEFMEESDE